MHNKSLFHCAKWWRPAAAGLLLGTCAAAAAAPHVPKDDATVLERLPGRRDAPAMAEVRELRATLAARPGDADAAAALARRYFDLANAQGDPRYIGYAEAALRPWAAGDAPVEVHYVRGLLRQYRHDFDSALAEFAAVLQKDAGHYGARAWRAAIFMVRADYDDAGRECAALTDDPRDIYGVGCIAYLRATTGKLRAAYEQLSAALAGGASLPVEARLWVLTRLAEMAWRLDDAASAERLFRDARALGLEDNFLLADYADFLLEQGRPKEVLALLKDWTRSDTLLLRLAIAEHRLRLPEARDHIRALDERFAAAALRGERLHMGEEARFLLELKGDAKGALAVALANWQEQREPRDALAVLEAAVAARDAQAAAPVLAWLRESNFESSRLRRLAASLQ